MKKYIVYSPKYSERDGGAIVLHKLCELLNQNQQKAYIWPMGRSASFDISAYIGYGYIKLKNIVKAFMYGRAKPEVINPVATKQDLVDAIVIYPEIVNGNPLNAKHVVRWFLNKPGAITGKVNYGSGEQYFYFQEAFNEQMFNPDSDNKLMVTVFNEDVFYQTNFGKRQGRCFILRKGKKRKLKHAIQKHEVVDGLNHKKMAKIFNRVEFCYSYDMHTMYSVFAAMCGCKSIIVPEESMTIDEWQPVEAMRYGLAYGEDNIEWAVNTKEKMIEYQKQKALESIEFVKQFISKSQSFFADI